MEYHFQGIVSGSQAQILKSSNGWMVALSKTLSTWWPWVGQACYCYEYFLVLKDVTSLTLYSSLQVAEGDFSLNGAKGYILS